MRYIRLCIISLLATLPLAVHASPQHPAAGGTRQPAAA